MAEVKQQLRHDLVDIVRLIRGIVSTCEDCLEGEYNPFSYHDTLRYIHSQATGAIAELERIHPIEVDASQFERIAAVTGYSLEEVIRICT